MKSELVIAILFAAVLSGTAAGPKPLAEIKSFSRFEQIDLEVLAEGEVLSYSKSLMRFPRGITVQTCYLVQAPPEKVVHGLQDWDPSEHHEELDVLCLRPLSIPPKEEDFAKLKINISDSRIKWLVGKTLTTTPGSSSLQLGLPEAAQLATLLAGAQDEESPATLNLIRRGWIQILMNRAARFQEGGMAALIPYQTTDPIISPLSEILSLLKESGAIVRRFSPLLDDTPLLGKSPAQPLTPGYYWDILDVESHATFTLGAIYAKALENRHQVVDCEYFVSQGYFTSMVFYEILPIEHQGKTCSLVWRGDFVSAPSLAMTKGIERIAYASIMAKEIKKSIRCFRDYLKTMPAASAPAASSPPPSPVPVPPPPAPPASQPPAGFPP
ncbi:MAG: hypothetical protein PHV34_00520 [Verrucomicrobiae bacterium]|nr:hypothetical protein [Verrucomicrobiae bacterium]